MSSSEAIGFNVETVSHKNVKFTIWDLGGQSSIRPYWRCYFSNTQAIVYVVDSNDEERLGISKQELSALLEEEELAELPLLVFANKSDLPTALAPGKVSESLGLAGIKNRQWAIFQSSAVKGEGLYEGLDWLVAAMKK